MHRELRIKAPIDMIATLLLFAVCSYIPSLLITLAWYAFTPKKEPTYNADQYRYNAQDNQDINTILQQIKLI